MRLLVVPSLTFVMTLAFMSCSSSILYLSGSPDKTGLAVVYCTVLLTDNGYRGDAVAIVHSRFTTDQSYDIQEISLRQTAMTEKIIRGKKWRDYFIFFGLTPGTYRINRIVAKHKYESENRKIEIEYGIAPDIPETILTIAPGEAKFAGLVIKSQVIGYAGERPDYHNQTLSHRNLLSDLNSEHEMWAWYGLLKELRNKKVKSPWVKTIRDRLEELSQNINHIN
jgi:hypothetical protein